MKTISMTDVVAVTRDCPKCGDTKPQVDFTRNASKPSGYGSYCRPCSVDSVLESRRRRPVEASAVQRKAGLKLNYGITPEHFDAMLEAQGGRCAFCRTADPGGRWGVFHVDHDHACCPGRKSCGECVRWLLCDRCNKATGSFKDDYNLLREIADKLENRNFTVVP